MKNINISFSIVLLLIAIFITSCKSSKSVQGDTKVTEIKSTAAEYSNKVIQNAQTKKTITARVKVKLQANDKNFSVNGTLRMKRDDVIQLSLTLFGFEVAKMEFRTDEVLLLDKYHKQYVQVPYQDVDFLSETNLDFYTLQAIFWNELFIPGKKDVSAEVDKFALESMDNGLAMLQWNNDAHMKYQFAINAVQKLLMTTSVMGKSNTEDGKFICNYSNFQKFNDKQFPNGIDMSFVGKGINVQLLLQLSDIDNNAEWQTRTEISSKYKKVDPKGILGKLLTQ